MEFAILGPVEVSVDGRALSLGGPKQRALLAILLLEANRVVSRDRLVDGLWGERAPDTAQRSLDSYVSRLRALLGTERVERRAPGYLLRVEPGELDLDRFETLVGEARVSASGDAAAVLREALALWRGPALADLLNEPFAAREADRLEERRVLALEERIDAELREGQGADLVAEVERLVREHPHRERLVAQLMLALYRAGRQEDALATFQAARRRLAEELGLEPGPQLQAVQRAILEHDPGLGPAQAPRPAAPGRPSRRVLGLAVAAVAVTVAIGVGIVLGTSKTSASRTVAASSQIVAVGAHADVVGRGVTLPGAPAAMAAGSSSLWLTDPNAGAVEQVDPVSRAVVERIRVGGSPGAIAVGKGAVWVADVSGGRLVRVDPATDTVTQRVSLGNATPAALAFGEGGLWVADTVDRALIELDPATGTAERTVTLPVHPTALAFGGGAIWVADYDAGAVAKIDSRSGQTVARIAVGNGPAALAFGGGMLWVANSLDGTVSGIDSGTNAVAATIPVGSGPTAIAVSDGSVWSANQYSATVSRIDPGRAAVAKTTQIGGGPTAVVFAAGKLWVGMRPLTRHRGGTLVLLSSRHFSSLDPQVEDETPPAEFLGLAADGLLAYDHTAGPDGLHLVPDLALGLPVPTDNGRVFTFQLRPGIRYSTGRLVRASDFARAMVRLFRVGSPGTSFFADLVGGRACAARPARCRLPQGVVADDAARTVRFQLARADPDFLFKLVIGFVVPIPPGTPAHVVGSAPIPGTGPYEIATDTQQEIRFVRNPFFHEWSHAAQPDGSPDEIDWRFGLTPSQEVAAILHGRADWTGDIPPNLPQLALQHPSQVHSYASPTTIFIQINTRKPPFDDVRVRRALNYALDRAAVVRAYGGAVTNVATCQVIPAGLPGYRRYCPYTARPQANGKWTAPDLRRARALVVAADVPRTPVTIVSVSDDGSPDPSVPAVLRALRELGLPAKSEVLSSAQMDSVPPSFRWSVQLLPVGWGAEYPSPVEFFSIFLTCNGVWTWHQFCDPKLDRDVRTADLLRLADPARSAALFARLDREVVDQAAWLPLVDQRVVDLASTRIKNYQYSSAYHFLPAQAWLR